MKVIVEEIYEFLDYYGFNLNLFCLSFIEKKFILEKEVLVVFVVFIIGEGDLFDIMGKFMRRFKKKIFLGIYL